MILSSAPDALAEAAYNVRAAVPDHPAVFAAWRSRSAALRRFCPAARLDLPYGTDPSARFDLFPAHRPIAVDAARHAARSATPCLIFLHGGYWQAMDKADSSFLAEPFVAQGIAVCVLGYPKCPGVGLADIVDQVSDGVRYIRSHARCFGLDGNRLHVVGHSAGGHLAAWLLTEADLAGHLCSVTAISGLFDLTPLVGTSINGALGLDHATAHRLSPIHRRPVSSGVGAEVPLLLAWGEAETSGFPVQAAGLAAAWAGLAVTLTALPLPGCDHFQAVEALADPTTALFRAVLARIVGAG